MTRRDPGPPRRLQDGARVAYLEWIGEVKPAKRLGKKVGRGLPPGFPRPTDASATPPRRRPPRGARLPRPHATGGWSPGCRQLEQAACLLSEVHRRASALDRRKALTPLGHRRSRAGKLPWLAPATEGGLGATLERG